MAEPLSILAVDDEKYITESIRDYFDPDYRISVCTDPEKALEMCRTRHFDILLADHRMPGLSGFELLLEAQKIKAYTCGIMLTAYADKDLLVKMINQKLIQFILEKPLDMDVLSSTFLQAGEYIRSLQDGAATAGTVLLGLDGDLAGIAAIVERAAPTDENILLTGETGTGKEVIARKIHADSRRGNGPFVKINCAAIPEHLLESELFGYERGAFTGAHSGKAGKIETAEKGTLFLDEIGEMRNDLQSKLLTVLQDRKIERLGSNTSKTVDFRLITATNRDISRLIGERIFRDDLYYRLNTVHIHLPALRERKNDILQLARALIVRFGREFDRPRLRLDREAEEIIRNAPWPGNIRELENALKRAVILLPKECTVIGADSFLFLNPGKPTFADRSPGHVVASLTDYVEKREIAFQEIEGLVLDELLERYDHDISGIVKAAAIPRDRLYRRLSRRAE